MNEKLHELELLLQSRDHKIQFLEEEHKNEVLRAAKAEDVTKTYRYDKIDGKNLKHYKDNDIFLLLCAQYSSTLKFHI